MNLVVECLDHVCIEEAVTKGPRCSDSETYDSCVVTRIQVFEERLSSITPAKARANTNEDDCRRPKEPDGRSKCFGIYWTGCA